MYFRRANVLIIVYQLVYLSKNDLTFLVCNLCSGVIEETKIKQSPLKKFD